MKPTLETWAAALVDAMTLEGGGDRGVKAASAKHRVSERSLYRKKKELEANPSLAALVRIKLESVSPPDKNFSAILEKPVQPSVLEVLSMSRQALYTTAQTLEAINAKALTALSVGDRVEQELLEAIRSGSGDAGIWLDLLERLTFILNRDISPDFIGAIARLADSTTELYQTLAGLDMAAENSRQYLEILRKVYVKTEAVPPGGDLEPMPKPN